MFCMGNHEQDNLTDDSSAKKIENYIFKYQDILGKGNFGSAYCGYDVNTGKQVAIKVIKMSSIKSKISEKLLENQIQILRSMKQHPNILKCCDVFTSVNNCYIITELCDHDLQKQLQKKGKFRQNQIKEIVYGIYKGLQQLAKNSIIHRDIKISNIFLTKNGTPKIADFGFAIRSPVSFKDLNIGSPLYMSPEGLIYNQYGPKTDVWSFGVILYQLINGETPLERCTTDQQLKAQILLPPRFFNPISYELKQLIEACLTVDQLKRPNIFQLASFPFMRKLIQQLQPKPFSLKQSSHISTQCSEDVSIRAKYPYFYKNQLSYQNSVSLLHYCRLLHKINKKYTKSLIFSQFLLNISLSLSKAPISANNTFNEQIGKLKQVLHEYYNKFLLEYEDSKICINPRQMIKQIEAIMKSPKFKHIAHIIQVLDAETKVLIYSLEHQNAQIFTKNSESKMIIQNNKLGL